jgi:hypothetical protein
MGFRALLLTSGLAGCAQLHAAESAMASRNHLGPPPGWHGPTQDELSAEPLRKNVSNQYVEAKADFDGDGKEDHAALFTADDGKSEAVFVKLSSSKSNEWTMAASVVHPQPYMGVRMGIAVAKPGTMKTACGKGYIACKAGEPAEIRLQQAGIDFFQFESANSVLTWNNTTRQFQRTWISD